MTALDNPKREGVPLTEELIRRKAEHNEGMLSTLEEIALHQLDIDKIETLNNCRHLKIVYLQSNLIREIEGLHRLKRLEYLNLALNNITRIQNLERCESLKKLDLTVNFIDLDEIHTVGSLKDNSELEELYLTGNPCHQYWENGCRHYVIATLPQLQSLDGKAISKSERLLALQRLPELEKELKELAKQARQRKQLLQRRRAAKAQERAEKLARGEELDPNETDEYCPEVRVADAREAREQREQQEEARQKGRRGGPGDNMFQDQIMGERRLLKEDGTPVQMNTAKWPFAIEDDGATIIVDVALPKFLDSAQIDADVQPTYVRVTAKKNHLQVILPAEVLAHASTAKRSATTGHLLLSCPKVLPIIASKAPEKVKKSDKANLAPADPLLLPQPGSHLAGPVSIHHIVPRPRENSTSTPKGGEPALGNDWDEEEEVPPLL